jgi:broad specificity phosphatase PhoE
MGKTIITCFRHAQGYHNFSTANHALPDPDLTPLGESQCRTLAASFPEPSKITHLVASPLRRTLYTCLLSFPTAVAAGLKVLALPELQETSDLPCDTGSAPSKLQAEFSTGQFAGTVDLSRVEEGWNSKTGRWSPASGAIEARARDARLFLRELGKQGGDGDKEIIVVTHGGYLHYFTEDWDGYGKFTGTGWANTEFRSYEFVDKTGGDQNASLIETKESRARRVGSTKPLTADEQRELRASAERAAADQGFVNGGDNAKL